ncbi:MAG: glycosyltransferase, partial [Bradyrhizobium sp.]
MPTSRRDRTGSPTFLRARSYERIGRIAKDAAIAPTGRREPSLPSELRVDVIIPIYRGLSETRRCLESVLRSREENRAFGRLILIDDASPEPEIGIYLSNLEKRERVLLLRNSSNLGFVASVNLGMAAATGEVVLLNSDTEVHGNWIDRLAAQAYAAPRVGTVTPFSNNATICSYPDIGGAPELPGGCSVRDIDVACAEANAGRAVEIPTGVGFCMLITRACLDDVGRFDSDAFGMGYGEEVDFCLRAAIRGWRNLLAGDVFVFHAGETSFAESSYERKKRAAALVRERHPNYEVSVARWIERDPAASLRLLVTAALCRRKSVPVVLNLLHGWGGGTEKNVAELTESLRDVSYHLVLIVRRGGEGLDFFLFVPDGSTYRRVEFTAPNMSEIIPLLRAFGVTRIHVHHFLAILPEIGSFLAQFGAPYDLTWHDYTAICPRISLQRNDYLYCGEPDEFGCSQCLKDGGEPKLDTDILRWRALGTTLTREASRVICPSIDVAVRVRRYVPDANIIVAPYMEAPYRAPQTLGPPTLHRDAQMKVAILGRISEHKGGAYLLDCIEAAMQQDLPISWHVIGDFVGGLKSRADSYRAVLSTSGNYDVEELPCLIEGVAPHVIFFPQRWPETYSHTLSEAFAAGAPVLTPAIGAFRERTAGVPWCWTYPIDLTPQGLVARLVEVRDQIERGEPAPTHPTAPTDGEEYPVRLDFYRGDYLLGAHSRGSDSRKSTAEDSDRQGSEMRVNAGEAEGARASASVPFQPDARNGTEFHAKRRPLVSFIVASYNYESFIAETLSSILAQTIADLEVIVVDDASTDRSRDVVRSFGDPRVQLHVNEKNVGLVATYNRAFKLSRGHYINYVDSDDWIEPRKIEEQLAYFRSHPQVDIVASYANFVDVDRGRHPRAAELETTFNQPYNLNALESWIGWNRVIAGSVLISRAAHERIGARDETMKVASDFDQWARARAIGCRFGMVQLPLVNVRMHEQSVSRRDPLTTYLEISYLLRKNILPVVERAAGAPLMTKLVNWHVTQTPFNYSLSEDQRCRLLARFLSPIHVASCAAYKEQCLKAGDVELLLLGRRLYTALCVHPIGYAQS